MDITRYSDYKAKGKVTVLKIGNAFAFSKQLYDPHTGEELPSEVGTIDLDQLDKQEIVLQDKMASINELKTDCQAL